MTSNKSSKEYLLSAGVVVVRRCDDTPRYLLLRAFSYWDFPKGMVEPGEDPFQAAQREVWEEAGLRDLVFRWGKDFQETPPYGIGKIARYYLAESLNGEVELHINPRLGRAEHEEFRWVDVAGARRLLVARLQPILSWADGLVRRGTDGRP
ncbi:bis(5'-nucleosyl)-tetraphosphatase [Methylotetracoccus oryzae]|uniref:bis(5'-nucleosyl)-tetraphosphatase n=1 Tax=Methylotetracoccus oryzae TaxID=1919059 RepID=UPI001118C9D2|nr:bis(5'-nucleosyl)-tetraphosphatase [Methylotetracoccus oryzae]